jgi:hypothetical protein
MPLKPKPAESEADKRGRLNADRLGQYVFDTVDDYVEHMRDRILNSDLTEDGLARATDGMIKSGTTIHNIAVGRMDRKTGQVRRTRSPFLRTAVGISRACGEAVAFIPVKKNKET